MPPGTTGISEAKQLQATGVLTFNGKLLSDAANIVANFDPKFDPAPDTEQNRAPLGYSLVADPAYVECDLLDISSDNIRMITGHNNVTSGSGYERVVFSHADRAPMEGELSFVGATKDGTVVMGFFRRAQAIPPGNKLGFTHKTTAVGKMTFVKCCPTDGATDDGYFQIGQAPA